MSWLIYSIGVVDDFKMCISMFCIASAIIYGVVLLCIAIGADCGDKKFYFPGGTKKNIIALMFYIFLCLVFVFVPNSKTIAAMYLIPKIANNEKVQQIPDKVLNLLNLKLNEWIKNIENTK